ncbi:hypothetical protein GCM10009759_21200 [Kitasatospora saccharophila]|uniref:NADPH-dependent reductive aminase-like C-terminal domain-containing protein n=2 Tax=Kitasatospora saccharophila TaxID=407973 RepID=A0ABN2WJV2_9ACTN
MGTALGRAWLAAGHPLTVWNRTAARAGALAAEGATVAAHAFALIGRESVAPSALAPLLADWLTAMAPAVHHTAAQLESGDYALGGVSNLGMQVAGVPTFLRTAEEQRVSPELLSPYFALMRRRLETGSAGEDLTGVVDLLRR